MFELGAKKNAHMPSLATICIVFFFGFPIVERGREKEQRKSKRLVV